MAPSRIRFPLMALAMLSLLAASWAGVLRLGWEWPSFQPGLLIAHGPLMVSGFLGTLIGVERGVALGRRWAYLGPAMSGAGGLLLVLGVPGMIPPILLTLGSLALTLVFIVIIKRVTAAYTIVMGLGALCWLVGNLLWINGFSIFQVVMWWAGFLILTIAGERLELGRLLRLSHASHLAFYGAVGLFLGGLAVSIPSLDAGTRLAGAGMLALATWLLKYDIATRTIRKEGLPRFIAICLLSGYAWLGAAGVMGLAYGAVFAGPRYDALLHAIFLGFVFSMIFGHAPIIIPAILARQISFHPAFYFHLSLLHVSLLLRVSGDLLFDISGRMWGGLFNGVALLLFLGITAFVTVRAGRGISDGDSFKMTSPESGGTQLEVVDAAE
jgi:hypothetical protein